MKIFNSSNIGEYNSTFFAMKIDSADYNDSMTDKEMSIFVHEYIHFLQSVTTLYGIEQIDREIIKLSKFVDWMKGQPQGDIIVPIKEDIFSPLTADNLAISNFTWGDSEIIEKIEIRTISTDEDSPKRFDNQRSIVSVYLEINEDGICSFGAREIIEGMAYALESIITKDYTKSPDHPYSTALKVAKFIYPELIIDIRNFLVICDKSLLGSNPGFEYVSILRWLKEENYILKSPEDLFAKLENWQTFDVEGPTHWSEVYISDTTRLAENLKKLLVDDFFAGYWEWIDALFTHAINLRIYDPLFWIHIADGGYVRNNYCFQNIYSIFGSPIIETSSNNYFVGEAYGCTDTMSIIYFKAFQQILSMLSEADFCCKLKPWCGNPNNPVIVDISCKECPWNHPIQNNEFCTVAGIWHAFGLDGYRLVRR